MKSSSPPASPAASTLNAFVRFVQLKSIRPRSQDAYLSWVRRLAQHTGVACASLCTQEEVLAFLHHVQQKGYEGSTVNQAVCALRLFYRDHLGRRDWTCWSQIHIKRHAPLPVVLSRGEVKQLIGAVRETRFQVAFALIYHCGLRLNELCHLRVGDLDPARGMLRVIDGKGGKNRQVPVSPDMFAVLRGWWRQHRNKVWLFPGVGRAWKEKYGCQATALREAAEPMSDSSVQAAMRAAILTSRLKKEGITCHALRHSYATHMLEEGVSVRQLQAYLGHSQITATIVYLHLTEVSESRASEALRQLFGDVLRGTGGLPWHEPKTSAAATAPAAP